MEAGAPYRRTHKISECDVNNHGIGFNRREVESVNDGFRYPTTILKFKQKWRRQDQMHPTQKLVELREYLIKTYTQEGMTVLDNCMGSGTTGVACVNLNMEFIGIELDEHYFEVAKQRIESIKKADNTNDLPSGRERGRICTRTIRSAHVGVTAKAIAVNYSPCINENSERR